MAKQKSASKRRGENNDAKTKKRTTSATKPPPKQTRRTLSKAKPTGVTKKQVGVPSSSGKRQLRSRVSVPNIPGLREKLTGLELKAIEDAIRGKEMQQGCDPDHERISTEGMLPEDSEAGRHSAMGSANPTDKVNGLEGHDMDDEMDADDSNPPGNEDECNPLQGDDGEGVDDLDDDDILRIDTEERTDDAENPDAEMEGHGDQPEVTECEVDNLPSNIQSCVARDHLDGVNECASNTEPAVQPRSRSGRDITDRTLDDANDLSVDTGVNVHEVIDNSVVLNAVKSSNTQTIDFMKKFMSNVVTEVKGDKEVIKELKENISDLTSIVSTLARMMFNKKS